METLTSAWLFTVQMIVLYDYTNMSVTQKLAFVFVLLFLNIKYFCLQQTMNCGVKSNKL